MSRGHVSNLTSRNPSLAAMRLLFVSSLQPDYYGSFRLATLHRLGLANVTPLNQDIFAHKGLLGKLQFRTQIGPGVHQFNREVVRLAREDRVNFAWFDKSISLWPQTLRELRSLGVFTIDYVNDNCFGPRRDPGWRLYRRALPEYDLHALPREASVRDYVEHGARHVMRIRFTYEPSVHFPPLYPVDDRERSRLGSREVSFIGTPYDDRAEFLSQLWREGLPVTISGSPPHWQRALSPETFSAVFREKELKGAAYREAIWRSKINLSFVTRANLDDVAHKSFEIAACGGFLLAERTPEHLACFREDEEAVFFNGVEECVAKIRRYLPDESARARIAEAGRLRAAASGYDNDSMMRGVLVHAAELRQGKSPVVQE